MIWESRARKKSAKVVLGPADILVEQPTLIEACVAMSVGIGIVFTVQAPFSPLPDLTAPGAPPQTRGPPDLPAPVL